MAQIVVVQSHGEKGYGSVAIAISNKEATRHEIDSDNQGHITFCPPTGTLHIPDSTNTTN